MNPNVFAWSFVIVFAIACVAHFRISDLRKLVEDVRRERLRDLAEEIAAALDRAKGRP